MRMSCNGCRVLRKGCGENCSIKPCLQWLKSPDSQANATVFLAKFYGRAGLINLINAGLTHLRPAIFRSLLYEACGRMVNPIYGSVGLLWSGSWHLCQSAVEAVLKGAPIVQIISEAAVDTHSPPLKPYDIRHVLKDETSMGSTDLHKVKSRCRFKRSGVRPNGKAVIKPVPVLVQDTVTCFDLTQGCNEELHLSTSHNSSVSHAENAPNNDDESRETESMASDDTIETSVFFGVEPESMLNDLNRGQRVENAGVEMLRLELTLGLEPVACKQNADGGSCKSELTLY